MHTEQVPLGKGWVQEVFAWIPCHANPLHHTARRSILRNGKRNNLVEIGFLKAIRESGVRCLHRVSLMPMLGSESPSDLDTGREGSLETGVGESNKTREFRLAYDFDGPKTETMLAKMSLDPGHHLLAFLSFDRTIQELRYGGIGIEGDKRLDVALAPRAKPKAGCREPGHRRSLSDGLANSLGMATVAARSAKLNKSRWSFRSQKREG